MRAPARPLTAQRVRPPAPRIRSSPNVRTRAYPAEVRPRARASLPSRTVSRMIDLRTLLARSGGLVSTRELHEHGIGRGQLAGIVRRGALVRVRKGWFAAPGLAPHVVSAARIGGMLSCAAALDAAGIWVVFDPSLHVIVPASASRLRSSTDFTRRLSPSSAVRVHWLAKTETPGRLVAGPVDALSAFRSCAPSELYLASLDSALHVAPQLRARLAERGHPVGRLRGASESGIETLFFLRMSERVPQLRQQVRIADVGRVDFIIGRRLVVEVDGQRFHDTESSFEVDRRRDAALSRLGFRVLRFSYRQVIDQWVAVEASVLAAVRRGDHC